MPTPYRHPNENSPSASSPINGRAADANNAAQVVPAGAERRTVDSNRPFAGWRVDGHVDRRAPRHDRWLDGTREDAVGRPHRKLRWVSPHVLHLHLQRDRARWHRWHGWLDQRARRGQDGHREAEGDGPQHRASVASARKAGTLGVAVAPDVGDHAGHGGAAGCKRAHVRSATSGCSSRPTRQSSPTLEPLTQALRRAARRNSRASSIGILRMELTVESLRARHFQPGSWPRARRPPPPTSRVPPGKLWADRPLRSTPVAPRQELLADGVVLLETVVEQSHGAAVQLVGV